MKKITILWLYPNILNNFGAKGNINAFKKVAKLNGIDLEVIEIKSYNEDIPYSKVDIIVINPGEFRICPRVIERLEKDREEILKYINEGKYILAFNTSMTIFGNKVHRLEKDKSYTGLNIIDFDSFEMPRVYGDDIHVRTDNSLELVSEQIKMAEYRINKATTVSDVIYGYGNRYVTKRSGFRYNNLICSNIDGPALIRNPWIAEYILLDILEKKGESVEDDKILKMVKNKSFDIHEFKDKYPKEVDAFIATLNFIKTKAILTPKKIIDIYSVLDEN